MLICKCNWPGVSYDESILSIWNTGIRGGSRTAPTSKMELFVITLNGFQPLTIITKSSILDVAAVLDPPLGMTSFLRLVGM